MSAFESLRRREFLKLTGLAAIGAFLPSRLFASPDDFFRISILHTTDLHGHILPTVSYDGLEDVGGFARCASQLRLWRRQNPNSITVDAGDVYQGTEAGFRTQGRQMVDCFNLLEYDGWTIGNHEFDWGIQPLRDAVAASDSPALTANVKADQHFENLQPHILREFGDFRVGIVAVTTPGMPFWFRPEFLEGFEVTDPMEPVRASIRELKSKNADAIVLIGHMGLRHGGDDFANRTEQLIKEFPEVVAFIGGHTHRDVPDTTVHGRPFTQASYHGIHCGKLDLVFEIPKRRLAGVYPTTTLMDGSVSKDAAVLSMTGPILEESEKLLDEKVGVLGQDLDIEKTPGTPSELERLIGAAISSALARKGIQTDAVFHGMFWPDGPEKAGTKTVADIWKILPYENFLVTAELSKPQLRAILEENYAMRGYRSLIGMEVDVEGRGQNRTIAEIRMPDGQPMGERQRATVAFNTFDAQSGGRRLMGLREILLEPETHTTLHKVQSRTALIEYFQERDNVLLSSLQWFHRIPFQRWSPTNGLELPVPG